MLWKENILVREKIDERVHARTDRYRVEVC